MPATVTYSYGAKNLLFENQQKLVAGISLGFGVKGYIDGVESDTETCNQMVNMISTYL